MTQFLEKESTLPPYMAFPRFLLQQSELSETAKLLYVLLLDRARLSQKNSGWTDERGRIFLIFPIKDMASTIQKSEMTVKTALKALEQKELILRKRQGPGAANQIYVKIPGDAFPTGDKKLSMTGKENSISDRQKMNAFGGRNLSGSNKKVCKEGAMQEYNNRTYECEEGESL